jgi:hypothetical protein
MSVFYPDEFEREDELEAIDFYRPSDVCFKCAKVLGDDHLVFVHGYDGSPCTDNWDEVTGRWVDDREIWLHVDCAHDLALALIEDYLSARRIEGRAELGFDDHDLALTLIEDYLKVKHIRDRKKARIELGLPPDPEDEKQ